MPLSTMLFSFTGRLNRARFWLASIGLIVVSLVLSPIAILSWVLIATSPLSLGALIAVEGLSVMPIASAGLLFVSFVYLLVFLTDLLMSFASLAVAIKRLHDRDKSAWWLLLFFLVPSILYTIAYYTDPPVLVRSKSDLFSASHVSPSSSGSSSNSASCAGRRGRTATAPTRCRLA
jgi:uncharacterized membrane protein YhaH (DUF805 family)